MMLRAAIVVCLLAGAPPTAEACEELSSSFAELVGVGELRDPNFPIVVARPRSIEIHDAGGHRHEVGTYEVVEVIHGCLATRSTIVVEARCDSIAVRPVPQLGEERLICVKMDKAILSGFSWEGRALLPRVVLALAAVPDATESRRWREIQAHLEDWCDAEVGHVRGLKGVIARMRKWAIRHPARCTH